jgi:hypothetical protein
MAVLVGFLTGLGSSALAYNYLLANYSNTISYNAGSYSYHTVVLSEAGYSLWNVALALSILVG